MASHPFKVSPSSGEPIYLQLIRQVKQSVASGVLAPGARLPSVRALASSLVINPNTVARAYRALEEEGLIESSAGRAGSFVASRPHALGAVERRRRLQPYLDRLIEESRALGVSGEDLEELVRKALERSTSSSPAR
jgi:GntR family transcriptional regulator